MRQGTSMRPGTGSQRLGTASTAAAGFVGGPASDLVVAARPATGLGVRSNTGAAARTVQDASYWSGLLRSRVSEITVEIARMRVDTDRAARDATLTVQLERRYDGAIKEVRALEGDLADLNLAMDKARTNVDVNEMAGFLAAIKRRNESGAKEVRHFFLRRGALSSSLSLSFSAVR
jgi:intraflagellar transport protein 74